MLGRSRNCRSYLSVKELNAKIRAFIDGWNDRCHPFGWTKTADQILKKGQPSDNLRHAALVLSASETRGRKD